MGVWTDFRDAAEAIVTAPIGGIGESDSARNKTTGVTGAINRTESAIGGGINRVLGRPSAEDRRNQQYAINDQIKAYKKQTALTEKQIADAQAEKNVARRQIQEKQIRALRSNYRPTAGYASAGTGTAAPSGNLGTDNVQPNKLGTS